MATGASKAKREAKKQAADMYYKELKKFQRVDTLKRLDTQGARKLDEQLDGDMSGRSKRLARQADKVGRQINKHQGEFNEKAERYNRRYDALQKQLASPTGVSKGVDYARDLEPGMRKEFARIDAEIESLRAQEKPNSAQAFNQYAPLSEEQRARAKRIQELTEERAFIDSTSRGLNNSYRNLDSLEMAFNDMAKESMELQGYKDTTPTSAVTDPQLRQSLNINSNPFSTGQTNPLASQQPLTGLASALQPQKPKFDINNMVKDESSTGATISRFSGQYEALGLKLKKSLDRDVRMNSGPKQAPNPTGALVGSMVIDPNANPVLTA